MSFLKPTNDGTCRRDWAPNDSHDADHTEDPSLLVPSSLHIELVITVSNLVENVPCQKEYTDHTSDKRRSREGRDKLKWVLMSSLNTVELIGLLVESRSCVEIWVLNIVLLSGLMTLPPIVMLATKGPTTQLRITYPNSCGTVVVVILKRKRTRWLEIGSKDIWPSKWKWWLTIPWYILPRTSSNVITITATFRLASFGEVLKFPPWERSLEKQTYSSVCSWKQTKVSRRTAVRV